MIYKKIISLNAKTIFAPIVTILILAILLSRIDIYSVYWSLSHADVEIIIIAMVLSIFTNFVSGTVLLHNSLKLSGVLIPYREAQIIKLGNYPIQNIVPMKLGEISIAIYLKKKYGYGIENVVYSALIKHFMLAITLLAYTIMGLSLIRHYPIHISITMIILLFSLPFIFLGRFTRPFFRLFSTKVKKHENIKILASNMRKSDLLMYLMITSTHVAVTIFNYHLMISSLGVGIPLRETIAFVPLIILLGRIPLSFAGIGIRESSTMFFFSQYASSELLFGAGILFSVIDYIFPALIGLLFTGRFLGRFQKT